MEKERCPECDNWYKRVSSHWAQSNCGRPELSEIQKEIIVGMLMGDGSIHYFSGNNQFQAYMINKEFLYWLDEKLGWISNGVSLAVAGEESARNSRESGFAPDAKDENYHDLYGLRSKTHPHFNKLYEWYSGGEKVWPDDLELTPTKLLMWYCSDGNYHDSGTSRRIEISMDNEADNAEKVYRYFDRKGLPRPPSDGGGKKPSWTVQGSRTLFEYMSKSPLWGGPPPGFEYKFPEEYGGTGKSMSDVEPKI